MRRMHAALIASVLALVATPWLIPHWLRWSLNTTRWGDSLSRTHVEALLKNAGTPVQEIFQWRTGHRVTNAAATGLWPGPRYLFISDGLLQRLSKQQLSAVVAHEAGHLRHGHLWQGMLSVSLPLLGIVTLDRVWAMAGLSQPHLRWTGAVVICCCWLVFHSRLAKLFEHVADWTACELIVDGLPGEQDSVARYNRTLHLLVEDDQRSDWLHPSNLSRSAFLTYLYRDASFKRSVRRQLFILKWGLVAAAATLLACLIVVG